MNEIIETQNNLIDNTNILLEARKVNTLTLQVDELRKLIKNIKQAITWANHKIVSDDIFSHEEMIHVQGLLERQNIKI